jgi:hypothetical protein
MGAAHAPEKTRERLRALIETNPPERRSPSFAGVCRNPSLIAKLNKTIGSIALGGGSEAAVKALARLGLSVRDAHG